MSRVSKIPILLPNNVEVVISVIKITINGPLGSLSQVLTNLVKIVHINNMLNFQMMNDSREASAMSGTLRALVNNMVIGVTKGFEKKLNLVGVGLRAQIQNNKLNLSLGFSHTIVYLMPDNIECKMPSQTEILIRGIDSQVVGQIAAKIRAYRKPEPYKGKGIRYIDEVVILKDTKKK